MEGGRQIARENEQSVPAGGKMGRGNPPSQKQPKRESNREAEAERKPSRQKKARRRDCRERWGRKTKIDVRSRKKKKKAEESAFSKEGD